MEATHEKDQYCTLGWRWRSVREQRHGCRRVYQRRHVSRYEPAEAWNKCAWFAMTPAVATNPVDRGAWLSSRATAIRTTMLPASSTSRGAVTMTTNRAPALASAPRA